MSLTSLRKSQKHELLSSSAQPVVAFADCGRMRDSSKASEEIREFLAHRLYPVCLNKSEKSRAPQGRSTRVGKRDSRVIC